MGGPLAARIRAGRAVSARPRQRSVPPHGGDARLRHRAHVEGRRG